MYVYTRFLKHSANIYTYIQHFNLSNKLHLLGTDMRLFEEYRFVKS